MAGWRGNAASGYVGDTLAMHQRFYGFPAGHPGQLAGVG